MLTPSVFDTQVGADRGMGHLIKFVKVILSWRHNHSLGIIENNSNIFGTVVDGHAFSKTLRWCRAGMENPWLRGAHFVLRWWDVCAGLAWNRPENRHLVRLISAHLTRRRVPHLSGKPAHRFCDLSRWQ